MKADQRARLMRAAVAVAASRGYREATLRRVLMDADVSQRGLYANFTCVGDVLLAACAAGLEWVLGGVEQAAAMEAHWPDGVREGLRCLLERVGSESELAWCCFVELGALGDPGETCRRRALARLGAALRPGGVDSQREARAGIADQLAAGGVWHTVGAAILAGEGGDLTPLLPTLHDFVVTGRGGVERWGSQPA